MKDIQVLFVDDEIAVLSSLERYLIAEPYQKTFISSPKKALAFIEKNRVDIVVSDMKMPEMDGLTFLRAVKKNWPETIRMVLSAFTETAQLIPCINTGEIFRYISKPIDPPEFKSMLIQAVDMALMKADKQELTNRLTQSYTRLKQLNQDLEHLSITDSLTSVYNPRYLFRDLTRQDASSDKPLSLAFVDVRRFKTIVDRLGHIRASKVLAALGQALKKELPSPCYAATFGSDLFVLVMPGFDKARAVALTRRLLSTLTVIRPSPALFGNLDLEFAFGVAVCPGDADQPSGLLRAADDKLVLSKASSFGAKQD